MEEREYQAMASEQAMDRMSVGGSKAPRATRTLDQIAMAADRVETLAARLGDIVSRFHGAGEAANGPMKDSISVSYVASLDRLHANLEMLDKLVSHLGEFA